MAIPPPYDVNAPSPAAAAIWLNLVKAYNPTHLAEIDDPPPPDPLPCLFYDILIRNPGE